MTLAVRLVIVACITGALCAKRGKRGILREARDNGRRKKLSACALQDRSSWHQSGSPLFRLFRPPTPTNIREDGDGGKNIA